MTVSLLDLLAACIWAAAAWSAVAVAVRLIGKRWPE